MRKIFNYFANLFGPELPVNENSKPGSLNARDFVKAFWIFFISTVISIGGDAIVQAVSIGVYSLDAIHWKEIGAAIVVSIISYLQKQLLSNSKGEFLKKENPNEPKP